MREATSAAARTQPAADKGREPRPAEADEHSAGEHREAVRGVRRAVLGGEDAAAHGVLGARLDEGRVGDVAEPASGARDGHPGEGDGDPRRDACEQQAPSRDREGDGDDQRRPRRRQQPRGERRPDEPSAAEQRLHRAVALGAAAELERERVVGDVHHPEPDERDHRSRDQQPQDRLAHDHAHALEHAGPRLRAATQRRTSRGSRRRRAPRRRSSRRRPRTAAAPKRRRRAASLPGAARGGRTGTRSPPRARSRAEPRPRERGWGSPRPKRERTGSRRPRAARRAARAPAVSRRQRHRPCNDRRPEVGADHHAPPLEAIADPTSPGRADHRADDSGKQRCRDPRRRARLPVERRDERDVGRRAARERDQPAKRECARRPHLGPHCRPPLRTYRPKFMGRRAAAHLLQMGYCPSSRQRVRLFSNEACPGRTGLATNERSDADRNAALSGSSSPGPCGRPLRVGGDRSGKHNRSALAASRLRRRALVREDARRPGRAQAQPHSEADDDPGLAQEAGSRLCRPAAHREASERTTFRVRASLVEMKLEDDSDIHLVIADPSDSRATMIAELPNPSCTAGASLKARAKMRQARKAFVAACGSPSTSFKRLSGTATISGVGFFDQIHGQKGVAPNGIELHPVVGFTGATCGRAPAPPPPPPPPPGGSCAASYPTVCIPPPPPDLNCADIPQRSFRVRWDVADPDPHHFDGNRDGVGCES